jgi:DNA-binding YbaB/EbfC family protein
MTQDFNRMMRDAQKSLQKMQTDMAKMQEDLKQVSIEGSAGGGAVKVTCNGQAEFTSVKIKPEAVDPEDVETLEDLVLAAIKDASVKTQQLIADRTGSITKGLNLPPGLGF